MENKKEDKIMNDQHYAAPNSDIQPNSTDASEILAPLEASKLWVRICSVVGFIMTVFIVLAGLGLLAAGSAATGMPFGAAIGLIYMVMGVLYFVPSWYLHKYAGAISQAQASHNMEDICVALNHQKSFWKFVGIMMLLMIVVMLIGMGAAILVPMMAMG